MGKGEGQTKPDTTDTRMISEVFVLWDAVWGCEVGKRERVKRKKQAESEQENRHF